jgi:hypothetical protein
MNNDKDSRNVGIIVLVLVIIYTILSINNSTDDTKKDYEGSRHYIREYMDTPWGREYE